MTERCAPPPDDRTPIRSLEVEFAMPVYLTMEQERQIHRLLDDIVRSPANQPVEGVHWVAGYGAKPHWSQTDARLLGKPVDPGAPVSGEPTFDDETYHIETMARPFVSDTERRDYEARRATVGGR